MKSPLSPFATSPEPLEARIAPAIILVGAADQNESLNDTEYNEVTFPDLGAREDKFDDLNFVNVQTSTDPISAALKTGATQDAYYLRLEKGDLIRRFTDASSYQNLVEVKGGSVILYFTDLDQDNEYDEGELTGMSLGPNASLVLNGRLVGDIVTNLDTNGTKSVSDDRIDLSGLVSAKQGIKRIDVLGGGVDGSIYSGGSIAGGEIGGNIVSVLAGTATDGAVYDFFQVAGGEGSIAFSADVGVKGSSIKNFQVESVGTRIEAGAGGFGAAGGSISNTRVIADSDGFSILAGAGGDGNAGAGKPNGGAGGTITKLFVAGVAESTSNDAVNIIAGAGGDATVAGKGGKGGAVKDLRFGFNANGNPSVNLLKDNLYVEAGAGGDGRLGGAGGELSKIQVRAAVTDLLGGGDEIALLSGMGGASIAGGGKAGVGGKISNVEVRNQFAGAVDSDILIEAGDAGTAVAGAKGAVGGSISQLRLLGFDLQVIAGDGSDGTFGGKGGSVSNIALIADNQIVAQNLLLAAGRGGNATQGNGGAGGAVSRINVPVSDLEAFLVNPAGGGTGGTSVAGKGGKGGPVSNITLVDIDFAGDIPGLIDIDAGRGGDGDRGGGAGGGISQLSLTTQDVSLDLASGGGGNATNFGKGGKGGEIGRLEIRAAGSILGELLQGTIIAGTGGDGVGSKQSGGKGGSVKTTSLEIEGSGYIEAGDGGDGQVLVGALQGGASGSGGSLVSVGVFATGGDASLIAGDAGAAGGQAGNGGNIVGVPGAQAILRGSGELVARAGDGAFGGSGGSIRDLSYGSSNAEVGPDGDPLLPTPLGSILIQAGDGSQGPTKGGKGGSIVNVNGAASSGEGESLQILAGDGGGDERVDLGGGNFSYNGSGKAGAGGSIVNISVTRGGAVDNLVLFEAGDAGHSGASKKGAAGGDINRVAISDIDAATLIRSFGAGDGGDGVASGGAGGSVTDIQVFGKDIGVRTGEYFGYTRMGGIFAGVGGEGTKAGLPGSVINISADSIASIVAGKGEIPQLANRVSNITLNDDNSILVRNNSFVSNNSFTLSYNGQTTTELPGNATAQQVADALNLLPDVVNAGGITVTGFTSAGGYLVQFGSTQLARTDATLSATDLEAVLEALPAIANSGTPPGVTVTGNASGLTVQVNDGGASAFIPNGSTPAQITTALNSLGYGTLGTFAVTQETTNEGIPSDYVFQFRTNGTGDRFQIQGTEFVPADIAQKVQGAIVAFAAEEKIPGETVATADEIRSGSEDLVFVEVTTGQLNFIATEVIKGDADVDPEIDEVQSFDLIPINAFPTAEFSLTFNGEETVRISGAGNDAFIALAADAALEALPSIQALEGTDGDKVTVVASATTPRTFEVTFAGTNGDVPELTGSYFVPETQRVTLPDGLQAAPGAGFRIEYDGDITDEIPAASTAAQVDAFIEALDSIIALDGPVGDKVTVFTDVPGTYTITFNSIGNKSLFSGFTTVEEIQQLDISAFQNIPGAQMRLNFDHPTVVTNETTPLIDANSTALEIQNALNNLDSVKATNATNTGMVVVTGGAAGVFTIQFMENGEQNAIVATGVVSEVQTLDLSDISDIPFSEFTLTVQTALSVTETRQFLGIDLSVIVEQEAEEDTLPVSGPNGNGQMGELDIVDLSRLLPVYATTGQLRFEYAGSSTPLLAANATEAEIDIALENLPSIAALGGDPLDQVQVSFGPNNTLNIQFTAPGDLEFDIQAFGVFPESQIIDFGNPPALPGGFSIVSYFGERTFPPIPNTPLSAQPTVGELQAALDQFITLAPAGVEVNSTNLDAGQLRVIFRGGVNGELFEAVNYLPEVQTIDVNPLAGTGNTFTVSFQGEQSAPLAETATALEVEAALNSLTTIQNIGGVTVTDGGTGLFDVFFIIDADVPMIQAGAVVGSGTTDRLPGDASAADIEAALDPLVGGGVTVTDGIDPGTFDVTFNNVGQQATITGIKYLHEIQKVDVYDIGQYFLRFGADETPLLNPPPKVPDPLNISPELQAQLDASAQELEDALNALPAFATQGVQVFANPDTSFDVVFDADGDQAFLVGIQPQPMDTATVREGTATISERQSINYFQKNEIDAVYYSFANFVGAIADINERNANVFQYVNLDADPAFSVGDRPLDGLIMARTLDQRTINFTPEFRLTLSGPFDNDNIL